MDKLIYWGTALIQNQWREENRKEDTYVNAALHIKLTQATSRQLVAIVTAVQHQLLWIICLKSLWNLAPANFNEVEKQARTGNRQQRNCSKINLQGISSTHQREDNTTSLMITAMLPGSVTSLQHQQSYDSSSSSMTSPAQDSNGAAAVDYNWIKSSSTTSDQTKLHKQGSSTSGRWCW